MIFKLWPSPTQWRKWSLPSKLTAFGCLIGLASLIFGAGIYIIQIARPSKSDSVASEIRALRAELSRSAKIPGASKEAYYVRACIDAIADLIQQYSVRINLKSRDVRGELVVETGEFQSDCIFNNRLKTDVLVLQYGDVFQIDEKVQFLKLAKWSGLPETIRILYTHIGDTESVIKTFPDLGLISLSDFLVELGLAGLSIDGFVGFDSNTGTAKRMVQLSDSFIEGGMLGLRILASNSEVKCNQQRESFDATKADKFFQKRKMELSKEDANALMKEESGQRPNGQGNPAATVSFRANGPIGIGYLQLSGN